MARRTRTTVKTAPKLVTELSPGDIVHTALPHMVQCVGFDETYFNSEFPYLRKLVVTFMDGGQFFALISPNRKPESLEVEVTAA